MRRFLFALAFVATLVSCEMIGDDVDDDEYDYDGGNGYNDSGYGGSHSCWLWDIRSADYFDNLGLSQIPTYLTITYTEDLTSESCGALIEAIESYDMSNCSSRFVITFTVSNLNYTEYILEKGLFEGLDNV